jgi:exosortase A-associated hydrolase 1
VKYAEQPVLFECAGERLVGVLARPETPAAVGLVVIVGGPQYRAGSHRQFVLLARRLAEEGFPTFRFDYRGMGDSTGEMRSFEAIDEDMARAIDAFVAATPEVQSVVLWGLCDGASAAMMYAAKDRRVAGLILANPWARGKETYAKTQLWHYYLERLMSGTFWRKLVAGRMMLQDSVGNFAGTVAAAAKSSESHRDYRARMLEGLRRFRGRVQLVISGLDLTAKEFLHYFESNSSCSSVLELLRIARADLPEADHTFSSNAARRLIEQISIDALVAVIDQQQS